MPATARNRDDVFDGEVRFGAMGATIGANMAVAGEKPVFTQANVPSAERAAMAAADHDDGATDYAGTLTRRFLQATVHGETALPQVVNHLARSVVSRGTGKRGPSHRLSV
jgi:hypothetical protein